MLFKNAELHNVEKIVANDDGSYSWLRVPDKVYDSLECPNGKRMAVGSTGVELRFVPKSDKVIIKMGIEVGDGAFHVFRGGIQGGWEDHEIHKHVRTEVEEFIIEKSKNIDRLRKMTDQIGYDWDCEVIRVIFDRGHFKIFDIIGDIEPPKRTQCPRKTLLAYGSSITHGSNAMDTSHSWVSILAHNLNVDSRNLGMAGSCAMEPEMIEYIASEGEKGHWDIATLELGINVLDWEAEKIFDRVENTIIQIAGRNTEKSVFVISPFYYCGDDFEDNAYADNWRKIIEQIVKKLGYSNVTYINGLDVIGDMSYMSADEVHPNIYGVQKIADKLTVFIREFWR